MSLEKDIEMMVSSQGLILYDTVIGSSSDAGGTKTFEILLKGENGVTLEQCAEISRLLSPLLDVTPPMSGEYRLEVGTAGIERKLKSLRHFELSLGELVKLTLINGELYKGELVSVEGEIITVKTDKGNETLKFSEIQKARTYFEW